MIFARASTRAFEAVDIVPVVLNRDADEWLSGIQNESWMNLVDLAPDLVMKC